MRILFYTNLSINKLAKPKKTKKPQTSVTVVRKIELANAGSCLRCFSVIGIK